MMGRFAMGALLLVLLAGSRIAVAQPACPPQPLPPAIDAIPLPRATSVIVFAATPWEHPTHAWIVRLSRTGYSGAGKLEVIRLLPQSGCNRYDIDTRWQAPLSVQDYETAVEAVIPLGKPPVDEFSPRRLDRNREILLDGTEIELRMRTGEWEVRRRLNDYGSGGRPISAIFRALMARLVPPTDMPAEDWRSPSNE